MIIVHHLNNSRSQRILWLLEELGVPYEIKKYYRNSLQQAPKELLEVNPLGKSPVVTDGDVNLAESGAIIEYLIEKYGNGRFRTTTESEHINNLYYTHYAEGSLMPVLVMGLIFRFVPQKSPWFLRPFMRFIFSQLEKLLVKPELAKHSELVSQYPASLSSATSKGQKVEQQLSKVKWIAGGVEPTSADFIMIFPLEGLAEIKTAGKNTSEYIQKVHAR
ncbi:related to glutathione S-transferase [Armillaria ostoyae]|uniref:glutathione transferase n=1 Tax=Armillaria ostoyae TaxID=47428 RepID=A0A284RVW6_ARMOS|nr:related to glutathione S-transferase [Armillaria ostoyae]